jgi:hypothetical protein
LAIPSASNPVIINPVTTEHGDHRDTLKRSTQICVLEDIHREGTHDNDIPETNLLPNRHLAGRKWVLSDRRAYLWRRHSGET